MTKILLTTFAASLLAAPASAEVETTRQLVKGDALIVSWQFRDDCRFTVVNVSANEDVALATSGQPVYAAQGTMEATVFNYCTGVRRYGYGDFTTGFTIDGVDDATLEIPVTFYDLDGTARETATLTATLTGSGETITSRYAQTSSSRSFRHMTRMTGKTRTATVTGSLVFDGEELLVDDEPYAILQEISSGTRVITRY